MEICSCPRFHGKPRQCPAAVGQEKGSCSSPFHTALPSGQQQYQLSTPFQHTAHQLTRCIHTLPVSKAAAAGWHTCCCNITISLVLLGVRAQRLVGQCQCHGSSNSRDHRGNGTLWRMQSRRTAILTLSLMQMWPRQSRTPTTGPSPRLACLPLLTQKLRCVSCVHLLGGLRQGRRSVFCGMKCGSGTH